MAAMDANLGYSCAKWRSFSAAIALYLARGTILIFWTTEYLIVLILLHCQLK